MDLVEQAEAIGKSKNLLTHIVDIKNLSAFDANQRGIGRQFWDKQKEVEREKKKKGEIYGTQTKMLRELSNK